MNQQFNGTTWTEVMPEKYYPTVLDRIKCLFGWHLWLVDKLPKEKAPFRIYKKCLSCGKIKLRN